MRHTQIIKKVGAYYTGRLAAHGPTHRGVDWNSEESQILRFRQLLKIVDAEERFSLNDYGCGYGALAAYTAAFFKSFDYHGFDVSEAMLETARSLLASASNCSFFQDVRDLPRSDYTVASGVFSVKLDTDTSEWTDYVVDTIATLAEKSSRGFAFNMLTKYSDPDRMRPDLYYADPHFFFDHCRERYSRHVALLHDYPLYEFSILVRWLPQH